MDTALENIKSFDLDELEMKFKAFGFKKYRAAQVFEWIYGQGVSAFDEMTNISKAERELLATHFSLPALTPLITERSLDGTTKFLFELQDQHTIESVLIPDEGRATLCVSSQVGCAQACRFCLTGSLGFRRNLQAFEIAEQVLAVEKMLESKKRLPAPESRAAGGTKGRMKHITNIVLMGMGEPLANFENTLKAIRTITADRGLGFSPRKVTVSTDGLVREIEKLGKSGMKVNLAVSLNATTDQVRDRIMPVNRRYPIKELLSTCRRYPLEPRRRITFEYVLLKNVNDSSEDALRLAHMLRGIKCKINLIPFNPFTGSEFGRPEDADVRRFQQILLDNHYTAPVRESRGRDISAACGQLSEKQRRDKAEDAD